MKIRLHSFGSKLTSEIMDIPENSTPIWDLILTKPVTTVNDSAGSKIGEHPEMYTKCRFEWTGKVEAESGARIYQMIDIEKIK